MTKTLTRSLMLFLCLASAALAALPANTIWEVRTSGANDNGSGFVWTGLVNAAYKWTVSGSGTNEYYLEAAAGGDPSITGSGSVTVDGRFNLSAMGTLGSLAAGEHAFGDNDTLGYTTLYVRLANGLDPDVMIARGEKNYVQYGAGGTDYSQQAAAQLSLSDIATDGAGTGLASATGGFTPAMKNNIIHMDGGGGSDAGWYRLTAITDANNATIDRSAGAGKTGITGNVGGAWKLGGSLDADFYVSSGGPKVAGNWIWYKSGTYSLGEAVTGTMVAGTATAYMRHYGYSATRGDMPTGTNRPLIQVGGGQYFFAFLNYNVVANLRLTGSNNYVTRAEGDYQIWYNVDVKNTGAGNPSYAMYCLDAGARWIGVTASTAGAATPAFRMGAYTKAIGCRAYDSAIGFSQDGTASILVQCIATNCPVGVALRDGCMAINCATYNCATGYKASAATDPVTLINCIADAGTAGVDGTGSGTVNPGVLSLFNCFNVTTPFTDAASFTADLLADPGLEDPNNNDFRVTSADPVYETGFDVNNVTRIRTH